MRDGRKIKLSVSLSPDLVGRIDRRAKASQTSRSAVVEDWLKEASCRASERQLVIDVESYYSSRSSAERSEDEAIGAASGRIARTLEVDG
jgi:predicted transcriptional regulator